MTELAINLIRTDGGTQPRGRLDYNVIGDYAQDMLLGDVFPPVIVFYDGTDYWLADGFHRYHAAQQICRETIAVEVRQGTRRDAVWASLGVNKSHGLRRTNEDKYKAVMTALRDAEWSQKSNVAIAKHCGVDEGMVRRYRGTLSSELPKIERVIERNGITYTMNTANIGQSRELQQEQRASLTLTEVQALEPQPGPLYGTAYQSPAPAYTPPTPEQFEARAQYLECWQQDNIALGLDRWGDVLPTDAEEESIDEDEMDALAAMEDEPRTEEVPIQRRGAPAALQMSESNEWYTPAQYVEAARTLMGGIDIDPASNTLANETIQATTYYDIETNGLDKDWAGRVWLNPPYGREGGDSNQEIWSHRLIEQFQSGITTEAILLVNANTEAKWFQPLYDYLICFTNHRIRFYNTEGTSSQPTQGNALIYFGPQKARFTELFKQFGPIVRRIA